MSTKKEIIGIKEASEILGVCDETLRNWEKDGKLKPFYTSGKHRRYYKEDIDELKRKNNYESMTVIGIELHSDSFKPGEYDLVEHVMNKKLGFLLSIESNDNKYFKIIDLEQIRLLRVSIDYALDAYTEAVEKIEKYQNERINFGKKKYSRCPKCKEKTHWYTTGVDPMDIKCNKCQEIIDTLNNSYTEKVK